MSTVEVETAPADLPARVRLATFTAEVAPRFQRLPTDRLDEEISHALRGLLDAMDMDRASITQFSKDGAAHRVTHASWRPGVPPLLLADLTAAFPWYVAQARRGQRVVFSRIPEDIPMEARSEFAEVASLGMKSLLLFPLNVEQELVGCLALSSFTLHREYSPEFLSRLAVLVSVFATALHRVRLGEELRAARDFNTAVMSSIANAAAVLNREGRIVAVNEAWTAPAPHAECLGIKVAKSEDVELCGSGMAEGEGEIPDAVRAVLSGRAAHREMTLRCECEVRRCSYRVSVKPLDTALGGAIVTRADVTELEESKAALEASLDQVRAMKERLESENAILLENIPRSNDFGEIVGRTPALSVVLEQVRRVAATDAPVLVLGETGTGKGLVARAIHDRSARGARPLVTVNCAALPPTLIDSELFGYEKGAFTGAIARTPGRFEVADHGTLLLDEIGELPLDLQAKLLRVLQTGEFERLGSSKTLRVDVRLVAATNRDLEREVREGRFRADLFYRLSVFPLTLPPLRDRPEDIPLLVWHYIARRQAPLGRRIERVPERVMRAFCAYSWPGNIRELENVVERALILSDGPTLATDPMFLNGRLDSDVASAGSLSDVERQYILDVLQQCGWKVAGKGNAADRLGLNRSTLLSRMKKLGINRADYEDRKPDRKEGEGARGRVKPPGVTAART
jgi:transcriptional regulator with GAF, ATPase, and Fis domain